MKRLITLAILALTVMAGCKKNDGTDNGGGNKPGPEPQPETPVITITTQPAATTTVTEGEITESLTVAATVTEGKTPGYQWYKNTTNSSSGGTEATGATATAATFTIPTDLTEGDYFYFCKVSAEGATSVSSDVATVTVKEPEYVSINGVKWAKTNVDAPGTFAAMPEDSGMFYQWNRKTAWPATGTVTGWDSTNATGDTWATANDPCPTGWRVPTKEEFEKLCDATKVTNEWVAKTATAPAGYKFTDKTSSKSVFFPASGSRYTSTGALSTVGSSGYYWSALPNNTTTGYYLGFYINGINPASYNDRSYGFSVRCVMK